MLSPTSYRTERVLDRLAARKRPSHQTPLQPRDKRPHYDLRHIAARYDEPMSQSHDTMEQRELAMATWLTDVAAEKKRLYGWSTDETIDNSSIDRATWYRWKKISRPGNMPKPQKLDEFCQSLGLNPAIPYGILGWGRPATRPATPEPLPESDIDRRIRLLRLAIDRPGIGREEQRELEIQLARLLATKRMNEDAIKDADQALKRYRAS